MSGTKRETWGSLRKLPSGRWQARDPAPDGEMDTARTEDDNALTFITKTDARRWLATVHTKISLGQCAPCGVCAALYSGRERQQYFLGGTASEPYREVIHTGKSTS